MIHYSVTSLCQHVFADQVTQVAFSNYLHQTGPSEFPLNLKYVYTIFQVLNSQYIKKKHAIDSDTQILLGNILHRYLRTFPQPASHVIVSPSLSITLACNPTIPLYECTRRHLSLSLSVKVYVKFTDATNTVSQKIIMITNIVNKTYKICISANRNDH